MTSVGDTIRVAEASVTLTPLTTRFGAMVRDSDANTWSPALMVIVGTIVRLMVAGVVLIPSIVSKGAIVSERLAGVVT
jgi:hypothetical protein